MPHFYFPTFYPRSCSYLINYSLTHPNFYILTHYTNPSLNPPTQSIHLFTTTLPPPRTHTPHPQKQDSGAQTGTSYISLSEASTKGGPRRRKLSSALNTSTTLLRQPSIYDLSKSLNKTAYFSDINPRNMKRLMNILALTSSCWCLLLGWWLLDGCFECLSNASVLLLLNCIYWVFRNIVDYFEEYTSILNFIETPSNYSKAVLKSTKASSFNFVVVNIFNFPKFKS